ARNQGQTYVALAHEIGTHLKPRLKFIRQVVDKGGITSGDLSKLVLGISGEHEAVAHSRDQGPKNPSYYGLVAAFAQLIQDREAKAAFLETYYGDVERYHGEDEDDEHFAMNALARHRLMQEQLAKIGIVGTAIVVIAGLLLILYFALR